jgi:DNA-binding GntR family transcriptional regulator
MADAQESRRASARGPSSYPSNMRRMPMSRNDEIDIESLGGTNYQRICDHLRADILDQRFEMGARLKVAELAARYRVSQMPIREALQQLQGEGLIRLIPNKGAVVRAVDEKFIMNIYDIREILEVFFTRRAALLADRNDIAELNVIQRAYERHANVDDIGMRIKLNLQLHGRIYRLAGNEDALEIIDKHASIARALVRRYNHTPMRIRQICEQHREIIAAIAARDVERAGEVAAQHMRDARDELIEQLRLDPVVQAKTGKSGNSRTGGRAATSGNAAVER